MEQSRIIWLEFTAPSDQRPGGPVGTGHPGGPRLTLGNRAFIV
jgi:hypothetical protein